MTVGSPVTNSVVIAVKLVSEQKRIYADGTRHRNTLMLYFLGQARFHLEDGLTFISVLQHI